MKKCFELTPCLLAFLCITSCVEDVDNERSKGMFSASQSGFTTIEVYDLGPLNKIDLSIAKAGLEDAGGNFGDVDFAAGLGSNQSRNFGAAQVLCSGDLNVSGPVDIHNLSPFVFLGDSIDHAAKLGYDPKRHLLT